MRISDLKHRVALCAARDVIENGSTMALSRTEVARVWAKIESMQPSFISRMGYAILEAATYPSHTIAIRGQAGLDITSAAWVYEERRKSEPRWYKVLGFREKDCWLVLSCHLVEKSDFAAPPRDMLSPQPSNVEL